MIARERTPGTRRPGVGRDHRDDGDFAHGLLVGLLLSSLLWVVLAAILIILVVR